MTPPMAWRRNGMQRIWIRQVECYQWILKRGVNLLPFGLQIKPTQAMPVPASYNDLTTDESLRDHLGVVWYERKFFVSHDWSLDKRVWLRFGSVHYSAIVVSSDICISLRIEFTCLLFIRKQRNKCFF